MRIWTSHINRNKGAVGIATAVAVGASAGVGLAVAGGSGQYVREVGAFVPSEKTAALNRSLPVGGPESTTSAPVPTARIKPIPATLLNGAFVPISPSLIRVSNSWMVSNGRTLVAVYAGTAGEQAASGRFVILRQDLEKGTQTEKVVTLPATGEVTITHAPVGAAVESSAQRGRLGYRGASGAVGDLDLATDTAD